MDKMELVRGGFASLKEAMEFLGIKRSAFYRLMERGEICYAKFGGLRRIPWRELHRYAAANLHGGVRNVS